MCLFSLQVAGFQTFLALSLVHHVHILHLSLFRSYLLVCSKVHVPLASWLDLFIISVRGHCLTIVNLAILLHLIMSFCQSICHQSLVVSAVLFLSPRVVVTPCACFIPPMLCLSPLCCGPTRVFCPICYCTTTFLVPPHVLSHRVMFSCPAMFPVPRLLFFLVMIFLCHDVLLCCYVSFILVILSFVLLCHVMFSSSPCLSCYCAYLIMKSHKNLNNQKSKMSFCLRR